MNRIGKFIPPVALLIVLFALLVLGARGISFTSDEPAHIATGYALIAAGKEAFWTFPLHGHPPLLNVVEAALLYLENPAIPVKHLDGWASDHIRYVLAFVKHLPPPDRAEIIARLPVILLTTVLGSLMFRWGKDLGGERVGLLTLFAFCFDPLLLAHGRLATTDAGTVALGTAGLYIAWRWMKFPSWGNAVGWGGLLGLTALAKGSGVLWAAPVVLLSLWKAVRSQRALWVLQSLVGALLVFVILWAGYAFTGGPVEGLPIKLPAPDHWGGLLAQAESAQERWVFALGLRKAGHWWWYFPAAFVLKNPLPMLLALAVSVRQIAASPVSPRPLPLYFFVLLYSVLSIAGGMNIGYRHLLPVHPLIHLIIGEGINRWLSSDELGRRRMLAAAIGVWYVVGILRIFPYEIAFFNELVGDPRNGYRYLIDSNLDWGQGYKALRRYLSKSGPTPRLVYQYTYILPEYYGIHADSFPSEMGIPPFIVPFRPRPGRYVLSITTLQRGWPGNDVYFWFRQTQPTAIVGYSFFVYDVADFPLRWIAQCTAPAVPLTEPAIAKGFDCRDLRRIEFNCANGWIYPFGGAQPGVYGFHRDLFEERRRIFPVSSFLEPRDRFIARRLSWARLSVDVDYYTADHPAFVLFEQEKPPTPPPVRKVSLSGDSLPTGEALLAVTPIALEGPLTFLGADMAWADTWLDVETWWQVTEGPIARPLSIIGHLLNGAGEMIGQDDGLGVSPVLWQPGDVVVQRHRFPLPLGNEDLWLRTGVYWLDTMERWPVVGKPGATWILVKLPPEVR